MYVHVRETFIRIRTEPETLEMIRIHIEVPTFPVDQIYRVFSRFHERPVHRLGSLCRELGILPIGDL